MLRKAHATDRRPENLGFGHCHCPTTGIGCPGADKGAELPAGYPRAEDPARKGFVNG
jgi:hypothetical protein